MSPFLVFAPIYIVGVYLEQKNDENLPLQGSGDPFTVQFSTMTCTLCDYSRFQFEISIRTHALEKIMYASNWSLESFEVLQRSFSKAFPVSVESKSSLLAKLDLICSGLIPKTMFFAGL